MMSLPGGPAEHQAEEIGARIGAELGEGAIASAAPLEGDARSIAERHLGMSLAGTALHSDADANQRAARLGALAVTEGSTVSFGAGQFSLSSQRGRNLVGHELTHVAQHRAQGLASGVAQRAISPENVASEMIGRTFTITRGLSVASPIGPRMLTTGEKVTIVEWDNARDTVRVNYRAMLLTGNFVPVVIEVPKRVLAPVTIGVKGVAPLGAGVTSQAAAVEKTEADIAALEARKESFKTPKARGAFDTERARLQVLLGTRERVLNRKLIQETMFNRFDADIKREVDAANTAHGLKKGMTWADAIRAYNGSGAHAEHYRAAVLKRAAEATARKPGSPFIPSGI
jgi:hypothetical protein